MSGHETAEQIADRWIQAQRALNAGDQVYAGRFSSLIRTRSPLLPAGIGDPLEAALFTLMIALVKDLDTNREASLREDCPLP